MKLLECYVENFGTLSNYRYTFKDSMNTLLAENGSGKTTLAVFIKVMLFGLENSKKHSLDENERKRYLPWSKQLCGGYLTFYSQGKEYRIERTFGTKAADDTFALYELGSGKPSTDYTENVGRELFGIDAEGFERTVFFGEGSLNAQNTNKSISEKLANLVGTNGDVGAMDGAMKLLEERRKYYHRRSGNGAIDELEGQISEANIEIGRLQRRKDELANIVAKQKEIGEQIATLREQKQALDALHREQQRQKMLRGHMLHYAEMTDSLAREKELCARHAAFFCDGAPTDSELNEIKRLYAELEVLKAQSTQYTEAYAQCGVPTEEELSELMMLVQRLRDGEMELAAMGEEITLPSYVPTKQEIEKCKESYKNSKKANICLPICLILAVLALGCGVALGIFFSPFFFSLCLISPISIMLGVALSARRKRLRQQQLKICRGLLEQVGIGNKDDDVLSALNEIERMLDRWEDYKATSQRREAALSLIKSVCTSIDSIMLKHGIYVCEHTYAQYQENLYVLQRRYSDNLANLKLSEHKRQQAILAKQRSTEIEASIAEFTSRFPTVTQAPIAEIELQLLEYRRGCDAVKRIESEIARYVEQNSLDVTAGAQLQQSERNVTEELDTLELRISELQRSLALYQREEESIFSDIEQLDVMNERLLELQDKVNAFNESLSVIQKTQTLLTAAHDNLTSRYLGKTKERFGYYCSLMDKCAPSFTLDTSFELKILDTGGSKQLSAYSKGTKDMYNLCMRLALIDALYESEEPFIILDDPMLALDDGRAQSFKALLRQISKTRQVIYLTCSRSRAI